MNKRQRRKPSLGMLGWKGTATRGEGSPPYLALRNSETTFEISSSGLMNSNEGQGGALLTSTCKYNSRETTTFECFNSTSEVPILKVATTVKWRLLHLAIIERQTCNANDRQTTTIASQQPWNDDFCRILQRPRNATTVKWQVRDCTIVAKFAWDFASLCGCFRFKCL